ncbi:MAG: type VI secretion system tip protein TssI/VgrG [Candidatus Acidiferrum sp.]
MAYTQDNRIIAIDTPLGKDVFLLHGFAAQEAISRLFRISAELYSENASIDFTKIIGQQVTISLQLADGSKRYFNGHISRFAQTGMDERFTHYHAEIVPWLWFLTRRADCRIFQNMTIPDIVAKVFKDRGFGDFRNSLQGDFEQREYCVQYRETDFNFVSRLMEQYGIFYFFEHEQNKHTLVMGNKPSVHKPCPVQSKARVDFTAGVYLKDEDLVGSWNLEQELRPGKYAMTDYNFETPGTSLLANENTIFKVGGNDNYEIFDYPGEYTKKAEGESRTQIRMQEEEAIHLIGVGSGSCRTFASGYLFDLSGHARTDQNQTYLLTEVQHSATVGNSYMGAGTESDEHYSNHFKCIPDSVPYRPQRHTPRPFVQGPQTAVVSGKSGEEIWTDKYGRVKVQFFWDREGKKDEKSSCWVRVSQPWAGKNWGAINIPRMGQEVIVEFLEGDPDRPLITGRVYNDEQMPPYKLADNQTRTTFLTRSTKGGGSSNFNELRFEDKKGDEQIFMNAEKDMDWRVEKESREYVGANRHMIVKSSQFESVDGDKQSQVGGKFIEKIAGDTSIQIGAKRMEQVGSDESVTIGGNRKEQVNNNESITIGQNQKTAVGESVSITIGQNRNAEIGGNDVVSATQAVYITGGMNVVIQAGMQLSLVGPGGFIDIGPAGVSIQGTMVLINSGGAPGSAQSANPASADSPDSPADPKDPDTADDGTKGGKLNQ